jgi:hypothetical protein
MGTKRIFGSNMPSAQNPAMEVAMSDKDKSVIDKLFKDTVSEVVDTMASAMTPAPKKKRKNVAATTNEQVYIPEATDAAAMPTPLFTAPARKRKTHGKTKPAARAKKAKKINQQQDGRLQRRRDQPRRLRRRGNRSASSLVALYR